jgi:glutaredoxin
MGRKVTHEEFVDRVSKVNPDITIVGEYKGSREKVKCRCSCGHEWEPIAYSLTSGRGCPKCGLIKIATKRRKSHEAFVEQVGNVNPNVIVIGEYTNMHTKVECECQFGHRWFPFAMDVARGEGCPQCGLISRVSKRTKTHEQFVEEVRNINPDITVVGTYKNSHTKIEFRCKEGHKWITTPNNVLSGKTCLTCANIQSSLRQRKSHEQFVKELKNIHPDITVIGEYVNSNTKIEFMCSKGHIWKSAPSNLLSGCSCPFCKGEKISALKFKTHEQFLGEVLELGIDVTVLGTYHSAREHILCRCNKCNHEWMITPNNLLRGFGCPKCKKSKGEQAVEEYLIAHNIVFETQKRFADCIDQRPLPFDFYLPEYNMLIEYQGAQHYMATHRMGDEEKLIYRQKHDCIKREYCKDKGINLLEIPYTNLNQVSEILSDVLNMGKSDLLNAKLGGVNVWQNQSA